MGTSIDSFSALLESVYSSLLKDHSLQDILAPLSLATESESCVLVRRYPKELDTGLILSHGLSSREAAEADNPYSGYFYKLDPFVNLPEGQVLGLVLKPVPRSDWLEGQSAPPVAVFISDPERELSTSADALKSLFELTAAEARLSLLLAENKNLDEVTTQLGISTNTGRAHLRAIFAKTGVTQQTQLVSLILRSVANLGRVGRCLERQGLLERDAESAWLELDSAEDTDAMPQILGSSVSYRIAVGPQQGRKAFMIRTIRPLDRPDPGLERVAKANGFSLHAGVSCEGHQKNNRDRSGGAPRCRYIARPPVAVPRLSLSSTGKVVYTLKTPYRDGTTRVAFDRGDHPPVDFTARLAALVPKPRINLTPVPWCSRPQPPLARTGHTS